MTAQSKSTIKSYFETGDHPTESQFIDFIDSYQNASSILSDIVSAASGTGVFNVTGSAISLIQTNGTGNIVRATNATLVSAALTSPFLTNPQMTGATTNNITISSIASANVFAANNLSIGGSSLLASVTPSTAIVAAGAVSGTWTPNTAVGSPTSINFANYVRSGNWVWVTFDFTMPVSGSGANGAVSGLPFPVADGSATGAVGFTSSTNASVLQAGASFTGDASSLGFRAAITGGIQTFTQLSGVRAIGSIGYRT